MVKEEAISDLEFEKSSTAVKNYNDIAMDSGGDYRYIKASRDGSKPITNTALLRSNKHLSSEEIKSKIEQSRFTNYSEDINQDRKGDYLYLLWAY